MIDIIKPIRIILLSGLLMGAALTAAEAELPTAIEHNGTSYTLCDDYLLRYGFVIKVAAIGWYDNDCQQISSVTDSSDKIIRFHYFKDVEASFFQESAAEFFLKNLQKDNDQPAIRTLLSTFNEGYTDIISGEFFDLVHYQGQSLSLLKNGDLLTTTDNNQFAELYFNIWFGQEPVIKRLKQAFSD